MAVTDEQTKEILSAAKDQRSPLATEPRTSSLDGNERSYYFVDVLLEDPMTITTFDDFFNPKFVFLSPVRTAITDAKQLAEHVDHAIIALDGRAPIGGDCCLEQLQPVSGAAVRVELWVNDLDDYTCTYGVLVSSEDGRVPYARGERTVVNLDPTSRKPAKWSRDFIASHHELQKNLPAYA